MNGKLERILKEQLDNYELPYENGAWEQFSKRLDGTPSTPFYRKWWFAASVGTVLVGSATYFALSSKEKSPEKAISQTEYVNQAVAENNQASENTKLSSKSRSNGESASNDNSISTDEVIGMSNNAHQTEVRNPFNSGNGSGHGSSGNCGGPSRNPQKTTDDVVTVQTPSIEDHFIKLQLPAAVCPDETFTIENPNDQAVRVVYPGGKTKTIQGKQSLEIKASQSGVITVETGRSVESIVVNEPNSQFYINVDASLLYENGIPTLKFDVAGTENAIEWESNVAARTSDRNHLVVHPFTERDVTVKAITRDQNGCKVTETEKIHISDPYNLLAPTGFTPSSGDVRTNTFIPYALTQRETPFEMVIMDPNNMTVLYTTSDASQGWTGQDGRSGQMVQAGTTWLWKVVMKNPLPGEPREYKGLITVTGK